jgi:hypothetical protein
MTKEKDIPKPLKGLKKADVVPLYAALLFATMDDIEIIKPLNALIVAKWSVKALEDIKIKAWKIVEA